MVERARVDLTGGQRGLVGAVFRYEVLGRLAASARGQGVELLAFGFAPTELRMVLAGEPDRIGHAIRGLKVGTLRAAGRWDLSLRSGPTLREPATDVEAAVIWAHRGPVEAGAAGPLASPWSSHRDLLGFRRAPFFDPGPALRRVDPRRVHAGCGGEPLPAGWPPEGGFEQLSTLLRVAGGVLGVLPADRRCFRLFVHLARARGWQTRDLAEALDLTGRRVRQLAAEPEPVLPLALATLGDPRLSRVP